MKSPSAFGCVIFWYFVDLESKAVEEFITSVFHYRACPSSGLCHLVYCVSLSACLSPSLVSPHPSYSLAFLLWQQ